MKSRAKPASGCDQRRELGVRNRIRVLSGRRGRSAGRSSPRPGSAPTTVQGPISTSSDSDSTAAAPSMKWRGASTWVPVCTPQLSSDTLAPSPAAIDCIRRIRHRRVRGDVPEYPESGGWEPDVVLRPASLATRPPESPIPREVPVEDVVKGYEVSPGRFVTVEREEVAELQSERSRTIDVELFVDSAAVDPV